MDGREPRHCREPDRPPVAGREPGEPGVGEDPSVDVAHHVEGGADDGRVLAQREDVRHRDAGAGQRPQHPVLALDLVRGRQERAGRLLAQHHRPGGRLDEKGRIRLPAFVLAHAQPAAESVQAAGEPRVEGGDVEPVRLAHLDEDRLVAVGVHVRARV